MRGPVRVRLGSRNDAKLEALRRGLAAFFQHVKIQGVVAPSGVSEQPMGLGEIVAGARNRALASWDPGNCELSCGIEDGLIALAEVPSGYVNVGCCVLWDGRTEGLGLTAAFEYPPGCSAATTGPKHTPIGDAFDASFRPPPGWPEPRPGDGNIGRLTGGALTRGDYGSQAVICAYVRLLHPELYDGGRT